MLYIISDLSYSLLSRIKLLTWKESRYYMISKSHGLFHIVYVHCERK